MNVFFFQKLIEEIRRLVKFLDVECLDDLIVNIVEKCEFDKLKKVYLMVKKIEFKVQYYRKGKCVYV